MRIRTFIAAITLCLGAGTASGQPVGNPGVVPQAPGAPAGAMRGTQEADEMAACTRANSATISLMRAAEEVIRSAGNVRAAGAKGPSAYQSELLERQFRYYKSLGGIAATPDEVRMPEDPCRSQREAFRHRSTAAAAEYRACAASRPAEMKLAALSREVVSMRVHLALLERAQQEKRTNPQQFESSLKGSGEWAGALRGDPALARAELARKHQEYRSAGGPAARIEEVRELPDPCIGERAAAPKPSPVADKRSAPPPRQ